MKIQVIALAVSLVVSNVALANVDKKQNKDIRSNSRDIAKLEKVNNKQDTKIERVDSASKKRDDKLNDRVDRVDSNSKKRDDKLNDRIVRFDSNSKKRDEKLQRNIDRVERQSERRDSKQDRKINRNARNIAANSAAIAEHEMRINALGEDISHLRSDMYSAVAGVAAMGAIPEARAGSTSIGIGYGNFGGTEASAFGISYRSESGKHAFKLSGTMTQRENGFSVGYSYSF